MEIVKKTARELAELIRAGELSSVEVTQAFLARIEKLDPQLHAFLFVDKEGALAAAKAVDADLTAGKELPPYAGVPIAIKDNICQRGIPTTCGSAMLEGWKAPYDATVVRNIKAARLPILGHTNMDEFAMGSSTEHSAFGPTRNPWDTSRIPGGSGGGSAAAVAAYLAPWALGSDTGGSIRQPGAVTGTVGAKPTYGAISRYGLIAMASSLDQIGPVARTVEDAAILQTLVGGHDPLDSTSLPDTEVDLPAAAQKGKPADLHGCKIGIVKETLAAGYGEGVLEVFSNTLDSLRERGAEIVEISCPSFEYALAAYYLIMPAEASSNLARFDGVRYGNRVEPTSGPVTAETMMRATREAKFGVEVKRRIILGTHVLSAGFYDSYYGSAQKVRTLVQRDLAAAFSKVAVLMSPTAPTVAFRFGENINDPMKMYLNDMTTIPANLAGVPAMTIPAGLVNGLPVGVQVMAPAHADASMYEYAAAVEALAPAAASECPVAMGEEK